MQPVGANAMLKFMSTYGTNAETVLGEILLYAFLETGIGCAQDNDKD